MKKYLALAAAGGALAIGVPAAFAATDAPDQPNVPVQSTTPTPAPEQQRPDRGDGNGRGDCPEHDGNGSGQAPEGSGSGQAPSAPTAPTEL